MHATARGNAHAPYDQDSYLLALQARQLRPELPAASGRAKMAGKLELFYVPPRDEHFVRSADFSPRYFLRRGIEELICAPAYPALEISNIYAAPGAEIT